MLMSELLSGILLVLLILFYITFAVAMLKDHYDNSNEDSGFLYYVIMFIIILILNVFMIPYSICKKFIKEEKP